MAIRELTEDEANFVSGSGDIVVVGRREYRYGTQYYDPGLGSHYDSNSTPVENAFDSWSYNYPANFDFGLDVASDKAATFIFDKIAQRPDANKVEYSGFVWVGADHKVHTTELIRGNGTGVDYSGITPQSIGGPGFTNWNQVVGVVHNHPSLWEVRYSDGSYKLDSNGQHVWETNPLANNPSAGDMVNLTYFANLAGGVDNVNVKSYI